MTRVMLNPLEGDVKSGILLYLSAAGWTLWPNPSGLATFPNGSRVRYGGPDGAADVLGLSPGGLFVGIEVKRAKGKTRPKANQRQFLALVARSGGIAACLRSVEEAVVLHATQEQFEEGGTKWFGVDIPKQWTEVRGEAHAPRTQKSG